MTEQEISTANDRAIAQMLAEDNDENVTLYEDDGTATEFEQLALIPYRDEMFIVLRPLTPMPGVELEEAVVFWLHETEAETELIVPDEEVIDAVFNEYKKMCADAENGNATLPD